jgi:hypothetical protein
MPMQKMIHGIKHMDDDDKLKATVSIKRKIDELQKIGWKKFWKLNNRLIKLLSIIFGVLLLLLYLNSTYAVKSIRHNYDWAKWYFLGTLLIFSALTFYIIKFSFDNKLQDYNTNNFSRAKLKHKGIDWQAAEEPFMKSKK